MTMSNGSTDQWEKNKKHIELYFSRLSSSNDAKIDCDVANDPLQDCVEEQTLPETKTRKERVEALKARTMEVQEVVKQNKKEAKVIVERQAKAEWAIRLCANRAEDLEACINEETEKRVRLEEELESAKEELHELQIEAEEKRTKLNSILEIQRELSSKVRLSSKEKLHAEIQMERAVRTRTEMIHGIEKLRRQRDVLRRRIVFCKEKDAIGHATTRLGDPRFGFRQFSSAEIRTATDDFSEQHRSKSGENWMARDINKVKKTNHQSDAKVEEDSRDVPSVFFCPIFQEIMKNPHVAADGFSYELEAIEEWLRTGSATSPMTNLQLKHNLLTPNHNLRSLIHEWQNKK